MAIYTLSFQIPEEQEEYDLAVGGSKQSISIDDFDNWLRTALKYGSGKPSTGDDYPYKELDWTVQELEVLELVRCKFWQIVNDED